MAVLVPHLKGARALPPACVEPVLNLKAKMPISFKSGNRHSNLKLTMFLNFSYNG